VHGDIGKYGTSEIEGIVGIRALFRLDRSARPRKFLGAAISFTGIPVNSPPMFNPTGSMTFRLFWDLYFVATSRSELGSRDSTRVKEWTGSLESHSD
jgi:hypothetical protein